MTPLDSFPWAPVTPSGPIPHWTGEGFLLSENKTRILAYGEASSHWSDELTSLHESEAGRDHPIDLASRRLAVESMRSLGANRPIDILDVGCSSGFVLEELQNALPQASLIGADYIRGPLEGLARRMPRLPLLQFDLRHCPLPDACVDGITCLNVLEHIDDHVAALRNMHRILRPGGIAHVEVPAGPQLFDIYDEHLMHHRRYRLRELVQIARETGFGIRLATHLGFIIYPVFWSVKKNNRRKLALSAAAKQQLVAAQIRSSRQSRLFSWAVQCESALGRFMSFPIGIRCVVVLTKG
ncbi:MAG: class I SAM-dependent methyltransferase [Opitutae bacterium]|nr:class I SAM-dependent methyltransferase [Opitutae bacterium]